MIAAGLGNAFCRAFDERLVNSLFDYVVPYVIRTLDTEALLTDQELNG